MELSIETSTSNVGELSTQSAPAKEKTPVLTKDAQVKRSKKEERQHKKEERSAEHFLKTLESQSDADKFPALAKKFTEIMEENHRLQQYVSQSNKRAAGAAREKEQLQLEYNRTVLVKCKLENLCRELQKQNKTIKDESLLKIREEEERRKETQGKFQTALSEITTLLQQNNDKNNKLREDNNHWSAKFHSVVEKSELREQQVEKMARQMSLEQQLSDAKLAKCGLEARAERERLMAEIGQLKLQLSQYQARILEGQNLESSLRSQLHVYTDKYDEFQNALTKSNQVFGGFKAEIDKMSKKIVKLEKECMWWKSRWQNSQTALLEIASDKQLWDERAAATDRQLAQMQRLCRSMQAERTLLMNTLKENNIERPPVPVLPPAPPAPAPQPSKPDKMDAMAANCAHLKQSLTQLHNQLNVLTAKKEVESQQVADTQPTGKAKKGKGKKSKADKDKAQDGESKQETAEVSTQSEQTEVDTVQDGVKENVAVLDDVKDDVSVQFKECKAWCNPREYVSIHDDFKENDKVQCIKDNFLVEDNVKDNSLDQVDLKDSSSVQEECDNVAVEEVVRAKYFLDEELAKVCISNTELSDVRGSSGENEILIEASVENIQANAENGSPNDTITETEVCNGLIVTELDTSMSQVCKSDLSKQLSKVDSEVAQNS